MSRFRRNLFSLTDGERCLVLAYLVVGIFGGGMAFVAVTQLGHGAILSRAMSLYEKWMVMAGMLGAMAGLYMAGDRMGQPGWAGHRRALFGAVFVTFVGSVVAGTLALPLYGTMFGPFTMAMTMVGAPVVALLWISNLLAAHMLIGAWRAERDSLFRPARNDPMTLNFRGNSG